MHADGELYFNDLADSVKKIRSLSKQDSWSNDDIVLIEKLLISSCLYIRKLDDHKYLTAPACKYMVELVGEDHKDLRWLCNRLIHSVYIGTTFACMTDGIDFSSDRDEGKRHIIGFDTMVSVIEKCSRSYCGTPCGDIL